MKLWVLLIMGAVSPFLFSSTLPSGIAFVFLLLTILCAFKLARGLKVFCLFPLFFLLSTLTINQRISDRFPFPASKTSREVIGLISSLPVSNDNGVRFLFLPAEQETDLPSKIYVNWYRQRHRVAGVKPELPVLRAGERWRLQLVMRAPRGRVNFHGVDAERWYFSEGIGAIAYVQEGENVRVSKAQWSNLQHWRELVLEKLTETAAGRPAFRILVALAIADRRGLTARDREVLSATGTGHLLAISGLHIGLAAVFGFYLGKLGLLLLSVSLKQRLAIVLPWLTAWTSALLYAALSGFGVSTQRALIMLTVATVVMLGRRVVHPFQAWLLAMSLVLLADPFAPLRAGFWFSFIAVAVLMMVFIPRYGNMPAWRRVLFAQFSISLVMAPLGMYWFQQASLPGLLANLVAIPVVSFLIVPLVLLGLTLLWLPGSLAAVSLVLAAYCADWLMLFLEFMSGLQPPGFSSTRTPALMAIVLAMLGAALFLLPRGVAGRYGGLLLMIPLLLPLKDSPARAGAQVDFLDVGQGLSVLLSLPDYHMIYDTGPGNGLAGEAGMDMVSGTIQPMIRAIGRKPDLIVASHADLDHAGGLESLRSLYPEAAYLASLPESRNGIDACQTPAQWVTGGITFKILHPSAGLPYLGNDSSCVISVNGPGLSLLLSGDITRVVEKRLVNSDLEQHAILTAPHHGSSTSSSQLFIDSVRPQWVLISSAAGNRFDFPRTDVLERYAAAHIPTLNTALCGGIRITTDAEGRFSIDSARVSRKAIWRWPANPDCP